MLPSSGTPAAGHQQLTVPSLQDAPFFVQPSPSPNVPPPPLHSVPHREPSSVNLTFLPLQSHYPAFSALQTPYQSTRHKPSSVRLSPPPTARGTYVIPQLTSPILNSNDKIAAGICHSLYCNARVLIYRSLGKEFSCRQRIRY